MPAVVAVKAEEAMGEDSAANEGTEFLLDEAGRGLLPGSRASQERLEVLADHLVEQGSLGLVALILDGGRPSAGPSSPPGSEQLRCRFTARR